VSYGSHRPQLVLPLTLLIGVGTLAALVAPEESAARSALVAPRDGARLPAGPVTVVLRDAAHVVDPVARLNGRRVRKRFEAPRQGRRRLVLTAAEGLRHGANRLVVRFGIRGRRRTRSVRFSLSRRRPLAAPRSSPVPIVAGQRTLLDARRSRARPARARGRVPAVTGRSSGAGERLKYRWRLLRAPRGSRYGRRGARALPPGSLTAARVRFRPDRRGRYVFRLQVSDGVRSAPARVEVDALPKLPMVPVASFAGGFVFGGIQVAGTVYPPSQAAGATLQLVVLDRATLELVSNTTIVCPNGPGPQCTQQTQNAVAGLANDKLVIAAAVGPWAGQDTALAGIGVAPVDPSLDKIQGEFSAIGVPGMSPGEATQRARRTFGEEDPGVSGYLARDLHFNYAFTSGDPLEYQFDTVNGTLTVGGKTFQPNPPPVANCAGGFHVWGFDPIAMGDPIEVQTSCTNVTGDPSESSGGQTFMNALFTRPDPDLLFVSSFGNPVYFYTFVQWGQLSFAFDQVGGFHHVVNSIRSGPYTLVDPVDRQFAGGGVETSTQTSAPTATTPAGVLFRDSQSRYTPRITDASGQDQYDLLEAVYQPATAWPIPSNAGQQAALSYIAGQLDLGTDIRDDYWTQSYDGARWDDIKGDIRALQYPGSGHGFTAADFMAVQSELDTEIGWLINVMSYIGALSQPFAQDALADWAQVAVIAQQIDQDVGTDDSDTAESSILETVGDVLDASSYLIDAAEPELGMAAAGLFLAADVADAENGTSATDPVSASVANFGAQLAQRFEDTQTSYERIQDVIASDYGRLRTVGTLGGCPASAQNCPAQWQWDGQSAEDASSSLLLTTRRQIYAAFMPLKYIYWDISAYGVTNANQIFCTTGIHGEGYVPFPNATPSGQIVLRDDPANQSSRYVLASPNQNSDGSFDTPAQSLTDSLYAAPSANGLGFYAPYFLMHDIPIQIFNPPCVQ
jgi:hypothetical protein